MQTSITRAAKAAVLTAWFSLAIASFAQAGPFLLQPASETSSASNATLEDLSILDPLPTIITVTDEDEGFDVSSRSSGVGPTSWGGATGQSESEVVANFSDSLLSVVGSASASAHGPSAVTTASATGMFGNFINFRVDTTGLYRVYGSISGTVNGGSNPVVIANLSVDTFNQFLFVNSGNLTGSVSFDTEISLMANVDYQFGYSGSAQATSNNGASTASALLNFEAYFEPAPAAVPEPSSLLLVGGVAAAGYVRRRRGSRNKKKKLLEIRPTSLA